jgi:hypothetical protein
MALDAKLPSPPNSKAFDMKSPPPPPLGDEGHIICEQQTVTGVQLVTKLIFQNHPNWYCRYINFLLGCPAKNFNLYSKFNEDIEERVPISYAFYKIIILAFWTQDTLLWNVL